MSTSLPTAPFCTIHAYFRLEQTQKYEKSLQDQLIPLRENDWQDEGWQIPSEEELESIRARLINPKSRFRDCDTEVFLHTRIDGRGTPALLTFADKDRRLLPRDIDLEIRRFSSFQDLIPTNAIKKYRANKTRSVVLVSFKFKDATQLQCGQLYDETIDLEADEAKVRPTLKQKVRDLEDCIRGKERPRTSHDDGRHRSGGLPSGPPIGHGQPFSSGMARSVSQASSSVTLPASSTWDSSKPPMGCYMYTKYDRAKNSFPARQSSTAATSQPSVASEEPERPERPLLRPVGTVQDFKLEVSQLEKVEDAVSEKFCRGWERYYLDGMRRGDSFILKVTWYPRPRWFIVLEQCDVADGYSGVVCLALETNHGKGMAGLAIGKRLPNIPVVMADDSDSNSPPWDAQAPVLIMEGQCEKNKKTMVNIACATVLVLPKDNQDRSFLYGCRDGWLKPESLVTLEETAEHFREGIPAKYVQAHVEFNLGRTKGLSQHGFKVPFVPLPDARDLSCHYCPKLGREECLILKRVLNIPEDYDRDKGGDKAEMKAGSVSVLDAFGYDDNKHRLNISWGLWKAGTAGEDLKKFLNNQNKNKNRTEDF